MASREIKVTLDLDELMAPLAARLRAAADALVPPTQTVPALTPDDHRRLARLDSLLLVGAEGDATVNDSYWGFVHAEDLFRFLRTGMYPNGVDEGQVR